MEKIIYALMMLSLVVTSCGHKYESLEDLHQTPEEFTQHVQQGQAYLIDVRTPEEYTSGHLKYAVNINLNAPDFKQQINKLSKDKPVYLYCRKGGRSNKAADSLKAYGFSHSHSIGGLEQLREQGLTTE